MSHFAILGIAVAIMLCISIPDCRARGTVEPSAGVWIACIIIAIIAGYIIVTTP